MATPRTNKPPNDLKWYEGNEQDLLLLRQCLDIYNKDEINAALFAYTKTIELVSSEFPNMDVVQRQDWAIANALSPDWFNSSLTTRIQNSMLISALLLTVTAASFLNPVGSDNTDITFRVNCYLNGICCALFLASIFIGVCFIENAMNRAYCWSDRFILIMKFYFLKDLSQIFASGGTIIFPIALLIPMNNTYMDDDCIAFYVIFGVLGSIIIFYLFMSVRAAAAAQNVRTKRLGKITDSSSGRLLPRFLPPCEGSLTELKSAKSSNGIDSHNNDTIPVEAPEKILASMYYSEFLKYKDSTLGFIKL